MNHIRQTTLQGRLSAMFRGLMVGAVATLVFSCVYFSPLIDQKMTIAAAAKSKGDHNDDGDDDNDRGDRDRGERSHRGGGDRDREDRDNDRNRGRDNDRDDDNDSEDEAVSTNQSGNLAPKSPERTQQIAPQSPGSGATRSLRPRRPRFSGDSEPQSEPLSAREEREAIESGWK